DRDFSPGGRYFKHLQQKDRGPPETRPPKATSQALKRIPYNPMDFASEFQHRNTYLKTPSSHGFTACGDTENSGGVLESAHSSIYNKRERCLQRETIAWTPIPVPVKAVQTKRSMFTESKALSKSS
ncbi:10361_t:CDS:2, partial [Paraglomus occultum]